MISILDDDEAFRRLRMFLAGDYLDAQERAEVFVWVEAKAEEASSADSRLARCTRLERQLHEMQAKLNAGASLQQLNAERAARPPVTNLEDMPKAQIAVGTLALEVAP